MKKDNKSMELNLNSNFDEEVRSYRDNLINTLVKYNIRYIGYVIEIIGEFSHKNNLLYPQNEKELEKAIKCLELYVRIHNDVKHRTDNYANNSAMNNNILLLESVTDIEKKKIYEQEMIKSYSNSYMYGKYMVDLYEFRNCINFHYLMEKYMKEAENKGMKQSEFLKIYSMNSIAAIIKVNFSLMKSNPTFFRFIKSNDRKKGIEKYIGKYDAIMEYLNCFEVQESDSFQMNLTE